MKITKVIEEVEFMLTDEAKQDKRLNPIDKDVLAGLQFFGNGKINQHNHDGWFPLSLKKSDKLKSLSLEKLLNDWGVKVSYSTISRSINKLSYMGYIEYTVGSWNAKQGSLPYVKLLRGTIPDLKGSSRCFIDEMNCDTDDCRDIATASIDDLEGQNGGKNVSTSTNGGCDDIAITIEKEQEKEKEKERKHEEHKVIIADSHLNETVTDKKDNNNFKFENLGKRGGGTEEESMDAEEVEERKDDGYIPDEDENNALPFDETETPTEGYSNNNTNNDKMLTLQERKEKQADLLERWDDFLSSMKNLSETDSKQYLNNYKAEAAVYFTGDYIALTQERMQRMYDEAIKKRLTPKAKRDRPNLPFSEDDIRGWVFDCVEREMNSLQTQKEVEKIALTYINSREDYVKVRDSVQKKVNYYHSTYSRPVDPDPNPLPF